MSEDGRLLRQYREQGSEAAFARLAARHLSFVYATCLRETENAALAEEAAQVVFLLLARKAPLVRPGQSLSGWLFQTARFVARNARRREERRKAWEERAMEQMPSAEGESDALWDRLSPTLNDALASLGTKDREAVLLRFADGLSFPELGAALGTSEDAARMRLNRAIDRLRRFFAKEGVTLSAAVLIGLLADRITQAAPAHLAEGLSSGAGLTSPALQLHLNEILRALTMAKLKLAAIVGLSALLAGTLPFVTRAQNHPRRVGQKTVSAAVSDATVAASKPITITVPRSLHIVYSVLSENHPPVSAEYWVAAPGAARWTQNGRFPLTIATDGKTWTEMMEPPNAGSVIKVDARTSAASPAPTQSSLLVERARSWRDGTTGVYGPGVLSGEIPFLGFGQPGKIYRNAAAKITKTADGWEEYCRVPYGYGSDAVSGRPALVAAVLTYDRQGRLVRFRRNRAGDLWETSTFSDFVTVGDMEMPGLIRHTETDESGGRVVIDTAITYKAESFDRGPMPADWFTMQHPPSGTYVQDYRFANHKPTPGLAGENSSGVLYRYSGRAPLDEESRAEYSRRRNTAGGGAG